MNITCIRAGVKDLASGDLIAKALHVEQCLTGNPHFPAPVPDMAALHHANTQLQNALAGARTGAHALVAIRWVKHAKLERLLVQLSKYVMATAQGDVNKQLSSGFELRRAPLRITALNAPARLSLRRPKYADGDMLLDWEGVHGARLYQVSMTTVPPAMASEDQWTLVHTGTRRRAHVRSLTLDTIHYFRVCAMGTAGTGPYSAVVGEKAW